MFHLCHCREVRTHFPREGPTIDAAEVLGLLNVDERAGVWLIAFV